MSWNSTTEQSEAASEGSLERSDLKVRVPDWGATAGIVLVTVGAFLVYRLQLDRSPGGLASVEAEYGLIAGGNSGASQPWVVDGAGAYSTLLLALVSTFGSFNGFDAQTPRFAAALIGAATVFLTGLWLRRELGSVWGLAGAAVLAGSFWHLLFSRLGMGSISGAFALAGMLWCLSEARARSGNSALTFYAASGAFAGLAFVSAPGLRLLPLVVVAAVLFSAYRWWTEETSASRVHAWGIASVALLPFLLWYALTSASGIRSLTPWTSTPGLPGIESASLLTLSSNILATARALVLAPATTGEINLPSEPGIGLLLVPWALFGLLAIIRVSNDPGKRDTMLIASGLLVAVLVGISAVDPGHPGQLVMFGPLLAGTTTAGFQAVLRWANLRSVRYALGLMIVAGIFGNAYWTLERYEDWASDDITRASLNAGTVEAVQVSNRLASEDPVFISTRAPRSILDYLDPTHEAIPFDGSVLLPITVATGSYVLEPVEYPLQRHFGELLGEPISITNGRDESRVRAFRVDARLRQNFPLSVPTMPYSDGVVFLGYRMHVEAGDRISVLSAWQLPAMHPNYELDLRLRTADEPRQSSEASIMLAGNPLDESIFHVSVTAVDIPELESNTDLEIRFRGADGEIVPAAGIDQTGYLFLNRYVFERSN